MPEQVHIFRLEARFGAEEVFRALRTVCEHPNQRAHGPQFEFDWMARRVALSADSEEGLQQCHEAFLAQLTKLGGDDDAVLPGRAAEDYGRWTRPYGVMVQDAATYAELIGNSLVELGLRGLRIHDQETACLIQVRKNPTTRLVDYATLIMEFPLPNSVTVKDEGMQLVQMPKAPGNSRKRGKKNK